MRKQQQQQHQGFILSFYDKIGQNRGLLQNASSKLVCETKVATKFGAKSLIKIIFLFLKCFIQKKHFSGHSTSYIQEPNSDLAYSVAKCKKIEFCEIFKILRELCWDDQIHIACEQLKSGFFLL